MKTLRSLALVLAASAYAGSLAASGADAPGTSPAEVVSASDVEWAPLNPARGDKGPKAGALWGDRTGAGPSGFLVKFVDGFSSPPHIHNTTYRGVVIHGLVHNDDPAAAKMWMPAGSFWTQPAGESHITAANGAANVAYIEIDEGPYLVRPTYEAFDNGERPLNLDRSNVVWLSASDIASTGQAGEPAAADGPKVAVLWGDPHDPQPSGALVKLPAGFAGTMYSRGSNLRAVVIQGRPMHQAPGDARASTLEPGSYFGSTEAAAHQVSCAAAEPCTLYVRTEDELDIIPAPPEK